MIRVADAGTGNLNVTCEQLKFGSWPRTQRLRINCSAHTGCPVEPTRSTPGFGEFRFAFENILDG